MPGLFGWIDLGRDASIDVADAHALLGEMAARMSHTGREITDTWTDDDRRVAIARVTSPDLAALPWPAAHDGASDARAFVDGVLDEEGARDLAHRGSRALHALRGYFTAARWEPKARRLTLAVDRRASRPLVYARVGSRIYFAPEVKAILAAPGVDKRLDEGAIGLFLGAGYALAHQTFFASIRRLCGGEALVIDPGEARVETYWRYRVGEPGHARPRDLEEELRDRVRAGVERSLGDLEKTVVFLSGGVDSRAIVCVAQEAARRQGSRVRTVTWTAPDARPGSDRDIAQQVAHALGTRHQQILRTVSGWGARLVGVTYLLDGLTDVSAYHPYELAVMRDLAAGGARVVLRGDECFGWQGRVGSIEEAWLSLNLRSPRHLRFVDRITTPAVHARFAAASEAALAEAAQPFEGARADDAKDQLYFRHRLQGYLGSAAYLKHVVLDHRTPLLDEDVLELNARVPAELRADKRLFCRAAVRLSPELFRIPLARRGNLEDWSRLLASPSPVRRHVELELDDAESTVWEIFDRAALSAALPRFGPPPDRRPAATIARGAKSIARAALHFTPSIERVLVNRSHRAGLRVDQLCLRVMVLKTFFDLFVAGDGSRRALERQLARIESC